MRPIVLSIVIPAYNEAQRLPCYLRQIRRQAAGWPAYEVIIVDDGSTDGSFEMLDQWARTWPELQLMRHSRNLGKGAALRTAILAARGDLVLLADADGAAPIGEADRLRRTIEKGANIACGSRFIRSRDVVRDQRLTRAVAGRIFSLAARTLLPLDVKDTQCGFKMLDRQTARHLALLSEESGYDFDLEVLSLARGLGYQVAEVAIEWHDVVGSKVRLVRDGCRMFAGIFRVRRRLRTKVLPSRRDEGAMIKPATRRDGRRAKVLRK
jgi:dolichyl-phosphate beta-glucosyltransferase